MQTVLAIAQQFIEAQSTINLSPLGNGLINDTYLVEHLETQLVLQRINPSVFPQPEWLLSNLELLNQHVAQKPAHSVKLHVPRIIPTLSQQTFALDQSGDYWRALQFIPNSLSKEQLTNQQDAQQVGRALGHFHALSSDLDATQLHDTLPGFHITPHYLAHYQHQLANLSSVPDNPACQFCLENIAQHQALAYQLEDAKHRGELPLRVMHGDPKLNNFLFDRDTQQIISLIDLDTVTPGLLHYDIGDCLRSCCHDSETNHFNLELGATILRHYLAEVREFFTAADYHYLYPAIELIPFELGLRFFTDYLQGNRYFKVTYPEHNLQRAVQQFKLCDSIRKQRTAIEDLIRQLA